MQNNFSIQVLRVVKSFWLTSKKIPRTMRLVILFLFCFVGLTNATDSYAQSAKVTMNVRNQTVEDVLRAIEKQTEFSFFYNNAHINLKRLVTISANRNDIFKVLDEVFKNTSVEYKVIDKKIILSTELASVEQAHQEKVKVSGRVVDAAGEPVIGASVIEKGFCESRAGPHPAFFQAPATVRCAPRRGNPQAAGGRTECRIHSRPGAAPRRKNRT